MTAASRDRRPNALVILGRSLAVGLGVCGAGLLVGLPSPFVPDVAEPAAGVVLLLLAVRLALRRPNRSPPQPRHTSRPHP